MCKGGAACACAALFVGCAGIAPSIVRECGGDEERGCDRVEEVGEDGQREQHGRQSEARTAAIRAEICDEPAEQQDEAERLRVEADDERAVVIETRYGLQLKLGKGMPPKYACVQPKVSGKIVWS